MQLIPIGNYVLCTKEIEKYETVLTNTNFTYNDELLPIYKIVNVPLDLNETYNIGDLIITNSIPTIAKLDDCEYYLINTEYIVGKLI